MVDKVTYSQLQEIALMTDRSVEDVAEERGISAKDLADMKLKEQFGNSGDGNVDVASFKDAKAYCIVLPDGFKFIIKSKTDFETNSNQILELSPGINDLIKEHGYLPGKLVNGVLTMERIDGGQPFKVILNDAVAALTGEDGSHRIPEVTVTGSKAAGEERKYVNGIGNGIAEATGVSAGTFNNVYKDMSSKFQAMSDDKKEKVKALAGEYVDAARAGDTQKQQELERTILTEFGSKDGWINPSNGEVIAGIVVVVAVVAAVTYFTAGVGTAAMAEGGTAAAATAATTTATGLSIGKAAVAATLVATTLTACSDFYDIDNIDIDVKQITDNSTVEELMSTLSMLLLKIANCEEKIAENTGINNELVAQLTEEVKKLRAELQEVKGHLVTIITNQETNAENAQKYYQMILNAIGDNSDLLALVVDQLAQSNSTLNEIKELLKQNNADNKEILEAITKCKYGLDQLHEDNKEINKLLTQIRVAITNLPDELADKFSGYFKAIILGIADNGAKLQALTNLLTVVNKNIVAGNTAILEKLDKMQAVLDALFAKFTEFDANTTNLLNAIATAIANLTAKIDKIDLDKIQKTLDAILDKIGQNGEQMADMTKLLQTINGNVVLNGQRQEKILEAINKLAEFGVKITGQLDTIIQKLGNNTTKLDELIKLLQTMDANNETRNQKILDAIEKLNGNMAAGFTALIELGKKHNELQTETNNLINIAIGLLEKLPGGSINLEELIKAVQENTEAIVLQGNNANAWLQDIYTLLTKLNNNVVKGDEENNKVLNLILGAINRINPTDLSAVLAKLDAILAAIKDHKVKVVIVNGEETVQCEPDVDEGVKEDLDWLLG